MILGDVGTFVVQNKDALELIVSGFLNVLLLIASLTPTQSDDDALHRIQNLWKTATGNKDEDAAK